MRAVVFEGKGGPEVLRVEEVPAPEPGPEDVLVGVVSSALNRADLLQRMGRYPAPPGQLEIAGLELAGRVVAVGSRCTERTVGDPVMAIVGGGGHAEMAAVHERQVIPVPDGLDLGDAGAVPEVFITAFDALVVQGGLTSGRTALVHAGASGVGTAAIQIAKAVGAAVVVTTSSGKVDRCRALGADVVVDYTNEDFVEACMARTDGRGIDVVLDVVGGEYLDRNLDAIRVGGRIVQVGVLGEARAMINLNKLLPKRATLIGTVLRSRPLEEKIEISRRFAAEMASLFASGRLQPVIDRRYPLDQIADAHRYMASNANVGKIVIDVAPGA